MVPVGTSNAKTTLTTPMNRTAPNTVTPIHVSHRGTTPDVPRSTWAHSNAARSRTVDSWRLGDWLNGTSRARDATVPTDERPEVS
jgi:hypothetical protein